MNERSISAFNALLEKRRSIGRKLNAKLTAQRADYAALEKQAADIQSDIVVQEAELAGYDGKIDALTSGAVKFELAKLNNLRVMRDSVAERRAGLQMELAKAKIGLERRAQLIAQTRREVMMNDRHMDLYETEIDKIRAKAARRIEDAQDEETDEQQLARATYRVRA